MSRRARLTAPHAGDPDAIVAGLSVLLRQLLSLQDAGIAEVEVEGISMERLPRDARLTMAARPAAGPDDSIAGAGPALTARVGLVWHRSLPRRLLVGGYTGDIERAPLAEGEFVVAAGDDAGRRRAESLLFGALLKTTDGLVSRLVNRRVSLRVTRLLLPTGITPNQMTLMAGAFGAAAIAVVAWGGLPWLVPGALLVQAQSVLDGCDGELSRLTYVRSRLGEWLDQVFDDCVNLGFFLATGLALVREGSGAAWWVTVIGGSLHLVYQAALYGALITRGGGSGSVAAIRWWGQRDPGAPRPPRQPGLAAGLRQLVYDAGYRDFFTFLYLPAALLGVPLLALGWAGIIFAVSGITTGLQWLVAGGPAAAGKPS